MPASTSGTKSPFCINTNQLSIFIILRPRPRTYASTSPLLLLQLHKQQQLLSINIINSTNHHLQHAKLRIILQRLTSHTAYERSGGPPKRPAAKRLCILYVDTRIGIRNDPDNYSRASMVPGKYHARPGAHQIPDK